MNYSGIDSTANKRIASLFFLLMLIGCVTRNLSERVQVDYYNESNNSAVKSLTLSSYFGLLKTEFTPLGQLIRSEVKTSSDRSIIISSSATCGIETIAYINGTNLDGPYIEFYPNNRVYYEALYKMNRLWTIYEMFDINGNKLDYGDIQEGNGLVKMYSLQGNIEKFGHYKNGLKEGFWKFVSNTGHVDSVLYKNDLMIEY